MNGTHSYGHQLDTHLSQVIIIFFHLVAQVIVNTHFYSRSDKYARVSICFILFWLYNVFVLDEHNVVIRIRQDRFTGTCRII